MSRPSTSPVAHRSRRRLGQHFLEAAWVRRVVKLVDPEQHDVFLEIGAGRGALTLALAASGAQIIAVEMDRQLAAGLATRVPANVRVVARDFLALDVARLLEDAKGPVRVVGNVPYSVGAPILVKILRASDQGHRLADATLMLQHEVANRVTAEPGTADWGPLAIVTQLHADARRVLTIPRGAFRPMPKVTSALISLHFRRSPVGLRHPALLDQLVRVMFTQKRKMAQNALRPFVSGMCSTSVEEVFRRAGVDPRRRPCDLGLAELAELSEVLASERI